MGFKLFVYCYWRKGGNSPVKALVTGGNGFAAKHLIHRLEESGNDVWSTIRGFHFQKEKSLYMNLLDKDSLTNIFSGNNFDIVFHLAAITHIPTCIKNPLLAFRTNAIGTAHLCDAIQEFSNGTCLMNCSTGSVYGDCVTDITEDRSIAPVEPYGVSKAAAELYATERTKNGFIKAFSTRTFSNTGPGRGEMFSISSDAIQIAKILKGKKDKVINVGNLESERVVADVRDIVNAYCLLADKFMNREIKNGDIFNVSGDKTYSMGHFLNIMLSMFGLSDSVKIEKSEKLFRSSDVKIQKPDNGKMKLLTGWKPEIKIEDTLKDLVNYWLERI